MRLAALWLVFSLAACASGDGYVMPPNGGAIIFPAEPAWLSGVLEEESSGVGVNVTKGYPKRVSSEHLQVVNAGYWLNFQNGEMQPIYEFTLNVGPSFGRKVYTRTTLENPLDPAAPFAYEHHLLPEEKSTRAQHGPVFGVRMGETYTLTLEVFSDPARTVPLERVVQRIQPGFSNSSGCIELDPRLRPALLVGNAPNGEPIPTEKLIWPCKRSTSE